MLGMIRKERLNNVILLILFGKFWLLAERLNWMLENEGIG